MKNTFLSQIACALIAIAINTAAYADSQPLSATIEFDPINVVDDAGAKINNAILTYQGTKYLINFDGLSVGGTKGVQVLVTAEVYGLNNLNNFANNYANELIQDNSDVASSNSLWIINDQGVAINLHTNNPDLSLASGGDFASVGFGKAQ